MAQISCEEIFEEKDECQEKKCTVCEGSGVLYYNPNLNPNENAGITSAIFPHCDNGIEK